MKRYLVVIFIVVALLGSLLQLSPKPFARQVKTFGATASVCIFCRYTTAPATNVGNGYLVKCAVANFRKTLASCQNVDGISVSFEGSLCDVQTLVQRLQVRICGLTQLENTQVWVGQSSKICGGLMLDGNNVNVQIAFDGTTVTVGSPLILGGY